MIFWPARQAISPTFDTLSDAVAHRLQGDPNAPNTRAFLDRLSTISNLYKSAVSSLPYTRALLWKVSPGARQSPLHTVSQLETYAADNHPIKPSCRKQSTHGRPFKSLNRLRTGDLSIPSRVFQEMTLTRGTWV